jgi:hypothetical protein
MEYAIPEARYSARLTIWLCRDAIMKKYEIEHFGISVKKHMRIGIVRH